MRSKLFTYAAAATVALGAVACDEDNDQLIDLELGDERLLVASNTSGMLTKIRTNDDVEDPELMMIDVPYADGDGIGLRGDDLIAANRSDNKLHILEDIFDDENEDAVVVETTSTESIPNQRGVAVNRELGGSMVAVASADADTDDDGNDNYIYLFQAQRSDLELQAKVRVPFQLWGLEWDGDRLIAVMDGTDSVAVFEDFDDVEDSTDDDDNVDFLQPTYKFRVEGLTRTHGVAYEPDDDILFLTDIGDAGSDSDGAIHVITNYRSTVREGLEDGGGTLALGDQVRIAGGGTLLGNPVDVAYDDDNNNLFVAERARDGGRLLAFDMEDISDFNGQTIDRALVYNEPVAGASSVEYKD